MSTEPSTSSPNRPPAAQVLAGAALVALGVLFLLQQADLIEIGQAFRALWPLLLIGPALIGIVLTRGRTLGPYLLLTVGAAAGLASLGLLPDNWFDFAWPLILVAVGLSLLVTRRGGPTGEDVADVSGTALLGRIERRITSQGFTGGSMSAVMGGIELDLTQARPAQGGAVLRVFTLMGGMDLSVPSHWHVEVRGTPIMGGIEDSRPRASRENTGGPPDLVIVAVTVMGGLELSAEDVPAPS